MSERIINGKHKIVNNLNEIKTFILVNDNNNLSIGFDYIKSNIT